MGVRSIGAQESPRVTVAAAAVLGLSRVAPSATGAAVTEVRFEQPVMMLRAAAFDRRLRFYGTLNLEGASMPDGVLTPGAFGEGFFDRRHPHTYAHELIAAFTWMPDGDRVGMSIAAGKGFVAFGTDDPMNRPALRFPVNHHFGQILERAVAILGVRAGPALIEGTLFGGDEPERPAQWPNFDRFGDSWALRGTVRAAFLEAQLSYARVKSPEHREGAGPVQGKLSVSTRTVVPTAGGRVYALAEWARTSDVDGFFVYHSALGEIEYALGAHRPYYRFERSERPEEERLLDPFRSVRPHLDDSILGVTRWTIHTMGYGLRLAGPGGVRLEPLIEVAYATATPLNGGLFRPLEFYGDDTVWSVTVALRIAAGRPHRMGRYGVLDSYDP